MKKGIIGLISVCMLGLFLHGSFYIQANEIDIEEEKQEQKESYTIASGTYGTSSWSIDNEGTLSIGEGEFDESITPWQRYRGIIRKIVLTGNVVANAKSQGLFADLLQVQSIENLDFLDTSRMESMRFMFSGMSSLTSLDLSGFQTNNVTDMGYMFFSTTSLTSLDLRSFDTSNVTKMPSMFASMSSLTSLNVSSFDTRKVDDMSTMFASVSSLKSLDISSFDTSQVTNMGSMFHGMKSLEELNLTHFVTSKVTNMSAMFASMESLEVLDVTHFDTSQVTDMLGMFLEMKSIKALDLSNFNTANVTNMYAMFYHMASLERLDIQSFDSSKVTSMEDMLSLNYRLQELHLGANFQPASNWGLEEFVEEGEYTGYWQSIGNGTASDPKGSIFMKSSEFTTTYDPLTMADGYVRQILPKAPVIDVVISGANRTISGTAQFGNEVTITLPNQEEIHVAVNEDGTWSMISPVALQAGDVIVGVQTTPNGFASVEAKAVVVKEEESEKPVKPVEPEVVDPSEPIEVTSEGSQSPQTGVQDYMILWSMGLLGTMAFIISSIYARRKIEK